MDANTLLDIIAIGLGNLDRRIKEVSFDGDNKSSELIIVTEDEKDGHREFVISSKDIRELEDDERRKGELNPC
jgi:hypothetical protein